MSMTLDAAVRECYSVSALTLYLQTLIEEDPVLGRPVLVQGEISNVKRSSRGHVYFTLKDAASGISAILWASAAKALPFQLAQGMDVFVTGSVEIYAPSGTYSLVVRKIEPVGIGALQLAFEQIRQRLQAEGLFAAEYKKPLPPDPRRIGIITSRNGAVIRDMLRVIRRKNPGMDVLLLSVKVQGDGAAEAIAEAIRTLNDPQYQLDLIILGRGGGSLEDLFCFSEEAVVRAIFQSQLPVVTGIGHEPDFSLADAVADVSASTPTAAAELAVPDLTVLRDKVLDIEADLKEEMFYMLRQAEQQFDRLGTSFTENSASFISQLAQSLSLVSESLFLNVRQHLLTHEQNLARGAAQLEALSPLNTMARGYAIAKEPASNRLISSAKHLQPGQRFQLQFFDGQHTCEVLSDECFS